MIIFLLLNCVAVLLGALEMYFSLDDDAKTSLSITHAISSHLLGLFKSIHVRDQAPQLVNSFLGVGHLVQSSLLCLLSHSSLQEFSHKFRVQLFLECKNWITLISAATEKNLLEHKKKLLTGHRMENQKRNS